MGLGDVSVAGVMLGVRCGGEVRLEDVREGGKGLEEQVGHRAD